MRLTVAENPLTWPICAPTNNNISAGQLAGIGNAPIPSYPYGVPETVMELLPLTVMASSVTVILPVINLGN